MAPTTPSVMIGDILKYNMLMSMHQGQKGKGAVQVATASLPVVSLKNSSLLPVVPTMFAKWGVFSATFVTCAARVPELCGCRVEGPSLQTVRSHGKHVEKSERGVDECFPVQEA